ncbi:uncharacterized protein DUF924 [Rhizobium sp. PP-F2F-G38]|nr:uncharacterized protein DUF924 [Rhizobium sp. PP-WC-1G-195]PYE94055.1 uncharacterized protein DUF924 [Rhizobium sp. PP-F2F-G38]
MIAQRNRTPCEGEDRISAVTGFWLEAGGRDRWFEKDVSFDRDFRDRFLEFHGEVAARRCDDWMATADGRLPC